MARQMKDSGIEWIGEIPVDWSMKRVKHIFTRKNEKVMQENPTILSLARDGVKVRDISNNEGQIAESYYNYNPVEKGDLLLNPMDLYSGANCSISKVQGVISPAYINLRANAGINPTFYDYYFKVQYWLMVFFSYGKGVSYDNRWTLSAETLMNYPAVALSYEEQCKRANYLDRKCRQIDAIIARQQEAIEKLKAYKLSVISEAVTKGLDPNVPMKDSGVEWIGKIPEHWEFRKIKNCCDVVDCKNRTPEIIPDGDYIVVRTTCIKDGMFSYNGSYRTDRKNFEEWTAKGQPQYGDIFFTREAPMGEACLVPNEDNLCMGQRVMFFRPIHGEDPRFILYSIYGPLAREYIESKNKGSTVGHLKLGQVASLPLLYCAPEEQKKIANYLDEKCKAINELISCKQEVVGKLQQYKKSLIYEIVTGKKEVYSANGAGKKAESSS